MEVWEVERLLRTLSRPVGVDGVEGKCFSHWAEAMQREDRGSVST